MMAASGQKEGVIPGKDCEGTLQGDGKVLYLDWDSWEILLKFIVIHLKSTHFFVCELYIKLYEVFNSSSKHLLKVKLLPLI